MAVVAKSDNKFTAIVTLIGTLAGYAFGFATHYLDREQQLDAANTHQLELFTNALKPMSEPMNNEQREVSALGALYTIASAAKDPSLRAEQKRTVMSLVSIQSADVQIRLDIIYHNDPEAGALLNGLPGAKLSLENVKDAQERKATPISPVQDSTANPAVLPTGASLTDLSKTGWLYLGRNLKDSDQLLDAYTTSKTLPKAGDQVRMVGTHYLRDVAPSRSGVGKIVGTVDASSNVHICKGMVSPDINNEYKAVWVRVSLDGTTEC